MADRWTVTAQRQTQDRGPGGRLQDVMEVTFSTLAGTEGTVRVPLDVYDPEVVRQMVDAYVDRIEAVEGL